MSDRWCYVQLPGDGEGWAVVRITPSEPDVRDWPRVAVTTYPNEADRVCRAHNYERYDEPKEPSDA